MLVNTIKFIIFILYFLHSTHINKFTIFIYIFMIFMKEVLFCTRLCYSIYNIYISIKNCYYTFYKQQIMIPQNQIKCPDCRQLVREDQFKVHIRKCPKFNGIALKAIRKLPHSLPPLELKFIIAELDVCREQIQQQLFNKIGGSSPIKNGTASKNNNNSYDSQNTNSNKIQQLPVVDLGMYNQDIVSCNKCMKKFYASYDANNLSYVEECWHLFCLACIKKYIDDQFVNSGGSLGCPAKNCKKNINQYQIRHLIGNQRFQQLQNKAIRKMMNIIQCVKCHSQYQFAPGNPRDAPSKDSTGKVLTQGDKQNYAQNRFVCPRPDCKTEQCKQCKAFPYHIAMNCKDFKNRAEMMKCRYCAEPLTNKNKSNSAHQVLLDICNSKECQLLAENACTKKLPCGHPCCGVRGQVKCLPCLQQSCCKDNAELNGQSGEDYCNICWSESLTSSPCIKSSCGHIFHQKCLKKRYQVRWLTPRIFFNFCLCPLCKKWVKLPEENKLAGVVKANLDLYNKIQVMSIERLKFEECDKDEKLKDPKSPYFQKPNQYAMAIYAYFECFKCKNPYFGGRKNCAQAMNEPQNAGSFKPEELVCPNCCEVPIQNCAKHGKDFIQFKCRYCCSIAQWFCWGNTHFCEPCHKRQCNGDYVSKYTKDKLPKCEGPGKCPIGGNHNGNGDQKTLGCAICRNYKANSKNF